jgi:iron complex transport system substrate-binding protein
LIALYVAHLKAVKALKLAGPKPKVLVLRGVGDSWRVDGGGTNFNLDYAFALLGIENVVPSGQLSSSGQIDIERILLLRPDFILLDPIPEDRSPRALYRQPALSVIPAIKQHRVYAIPHFSYFIDPVEDPLFLEWLTDVFFPPKAACALRDDIRKAYEDGYAYRISDDEIDRLVMVGRNGASAGYRRFTRDCGRGGMAPASNQG